MVHSTYYRVLLLLVVYTKQFLLLSTYILFEKILRSIYSELASIIQSIYYYIAG